MLLMSILREDMMKDEKHCRTPRFFVVWNCSIRVVASTVRSAQRRAVLVR